MRPRTPILLLLLALPPGCAAPRPPAPKPPEAAGTPEAGEVAPAPWPPGEGVGTLSNDGGYWVAYVPPAGGVPLNEGFSLGVQVFDAETRSRLVDGIDVVVDARMPAHGHGMNSAPEVKRAPDGSFAAGGMLLHMTGHWELYVDITRGPLTERAQFDIDLE